MEDESRKSTGDPAAEVPPTSVVGFLIPLTEISVAHASIHSQRDRPASRELRSAGRTLPAGRVFERLGLNAAASAATAATAHGPASGFLIAEREHELDPVQ